MTDSRFNKGIEEIKTLSMTPTEKSDLFERIMKESPAPVKSPWTLYSFNSWITSHRVASVSFVAIIALILAGGGVASASVRALPGDVLYGVKVNVVEPLRIALASTPAAKAQVEAELANTRFDEARSLASQGKLNASTEHEISTRITAHTEAFDKDLAEVEEESPEKAQIIRHGFEMSAFGHARSLVNLIVATSTESTSTIQVDTGKRGSSHVQSKTHIQTLLNTSGSFGTTSSMVGTTSININIDHGQSSHASVHIDQQLNGASVYSALFETQATDSQSKEKNHGYGISDFIHGKSKGNDK